MFSSARLRGPVITGLLVVAWTMMAAGAAAQTQIQFLMYGPENVPIYQRAIDIFEERNPDIKVEMILADMAYWDKVAVLMATQTMPDVFMFGTFGHNYLREGALYDVTPFILRDGIDTSQYIFHPGVTYWNGRYYGLPWFTSSTTYYYNRDMFQQAGLEDMTRDWTWDTLLEAGRKLVRRDGEGRVTQYGFLIPQSFESGWGPLVRQLGGAIFDEAGERIVINDSPAAREALSFIHAAIYEHEVQPVSGASFHRGEIGVIAGLSGFQAHLQLNNFEWDIGWVPRPPNGERLVGVTTLNLSMPAFAREPEAAWEFIKFMASADGQREIIRLGRLGPAAPELLLTREWADMHPNLSISNILEQIRERHYLLEANPYFSTVVERVINPEMNKLYSGSATVPAVLEAIQTRGNALIESLREQPERSQ